MMYAYVSWTHDANAMCIPPRRLPNLLIKFNERSDLIEIEKCPNAEFLISLIELYCTFN